MKKAGLAALIHPTPCAKFESNTPLVVKGLKTTVSALTGLPCLKSLDALLKLWPDRVQAHLPKVADEASAIDVSPADASKLFENGMGLMFDHAHKISPELTRWLEAIRKDLGLSALTYGRCLIYATPKGKGTAPHFDQNVNFVLQIRGTKKWWLAPNRNVKNPLSRHTMNLPLDPELQTYAQTPLPTRMPSGIRPIVLEPGSLLFVPRGTWHSTEAESDALSLNFTYTAPAWLDLLTAALRSRLALSAEWRATAREANAHELDLLLAELTHDLPNWNASEILGVTESS